ncbi:acyltransferase family protein [Ectopseudomonas oleovorans]|uniref:Putative peptidoglycan O-acetyltransferase yrhL n=1 Tax=Ectopseudomonas oleovorans (strain CECT 5344) TaxID=1182590 RepID=W6QWC9_ECTO5|nr:acyltransferase family protein [Pseudomonas oleovorans]CDM40278.1 putative peptidoglycan O-acetyltransferase yrhL [Pseudomonas oleovorans CECT 5344]CDR90908.1 putative peptidoglycan O-acetyltransferase yrhL [Pseudomonas oleovorans]
MKKVLGYQPHVDGLRALAVALVILCHLNIVQFSGGYVGVDVFFVISGYLISKLIVIELATTSKFRFAHFYLRRARRILPALFFTCAWILVVAAFLFSPHHFDEAGASALHAIASLSNVYFWLTSDYFALSSETQPLLHTWSLAVEEQFYLFWPLLLLVAWRLNGLKMIVCCVVLAFLFSLFLSVTFSDVGSLSLMSFPAWLRDLFLDGNSLTYYLTPFRVFEFAAGAAVIVLQERRLAPWLANLATLLGGGMVLYAAMQFDSNTLFPHYNALVPVVGTVLLIAYVPSSQLYPLLSNRVATGVGKLSYSLYLVHWPVIVFYGYLYGDHFSYLDMAYILVATLIISYLTYRLVETPFRLPQGQDTGFLFGLFASAALLMLLSANIWATNGWFWRLDADVREKGQAFKSRSEIDRLYAGGSNCPYVYEKGYGPLCQTNPNANKHVWLMGDSHARHLAVGLARLFPQINFKFYKNNCRFDTVDLCYDINPGILDTHRLHKANIIERLKQDDSPVIIAQTWIRPQAKYLSSDGAQPILLENTTDHAMFVRDQLDRVVRVLQSSNPGRRVIVFGDVPRPRLPASASPIDCLFYPLEAMRNGCSFTVIEPLDSRRIFNGLLSGYYSRVNMEDVLFINPFEVFCEGLECKNILDDNQPVYTDNSHLSTWGSEFLIRGAYSKLRYGLRDFLAEKNYYAK